MVASGREGTPVCGSNCRVMCHAEKPTKNETGQYSGISLFLEVQGGTESRKRQSAYLFGMWSKVKFKNTALLAKVKPKIKLTPQIWSICCQSRNHPECRKLVCDGKCILSERALQDVSSHKEDGELTLLTALAFTCHPQGHSSLYSNPSWKAPFASLPLRR